MSEEKMYAIKNDDGEWSDDSGAFYPEKKNGIGFIFTMFSDRDEATGWAERNTNGGHIVTLIEEPKKVVLTKEQAKIVDDAHSDGMPAGYIFSKSNDEELLMNAYVNGYTVAKEKKYLLPMDGTLEENDDNDNFQLYAYCYKGRWLADEVETDPSYQHHTVTQKELETAPAWVKAIKPLEVTDDDD